MKETTVQKTASLHEKTVQAVAKGEVTPQPKRRRRASAAAQSSTLTTDIKVDPQVMEAARKLIDAKSNTYSTLVIIGPTEVLVR